LVADLIHYLTFFSPLIPGPAGKRGYRANLQSWQPHRKLQQELENPKNWKMCLRMNWKPSSKNIMTSKWFWKEKPNPFLFCLLTKSGNFSFWFWKKSLDWNVFCEKTLEKEVERINTQKNSPFLSKILWINWLLVMGEKKSSFFSLGGSHKNLKSMTLNTMSKFVICRSTSWRWKSLTWGESSFCQSSRRSTTSSLWVVKSKKSRWMESFIQDSLIHPIRLACILHSFIITSNMFVRIGGCAQCQ